MAGSTFDTSATGRQLSVFVGGFGDVVEVELPGAPEVVGADVPEPQAARSALAVEADSPIMAARLRNWRRSIRFLRNSSTRLLAGGPPAAAAWSRAELSN